MPFQPLWPHGISKIGKSASSPFLVTPFTPALHAYRSLDHHFLIIPEKLSVEVFWPSRAYFDVLYLLGFGAALFSAYLLNRFLKIKVGRSLWLKCWTTKCLAKKKCADYGGRKNQVVCVGSWENHFGDFILWVLASYGPRRIHFNHTESIVKPKYNFQQPYRWSIEYGIEAFKLEKSYIGIIGKDWNHSLPLGTIGKSGLPSSALFR